MDSLEGDAKDPIKELIKNVKIQDLGPFWVTKMQTEFNAFDRNKDGVVDYEDIMRLADKLNKIGSRSRDHSDLIFKTMKLCTKAVKYRPLQMSEWVAVAYLSLFDPVTKQRSRDFTLKPFLSLWFDAIDTSKDGFIDLEEFKVFWRAFGIDLRFAQLQFSYMDQDEVGKIDKFNFLEAYDDYYYNDCATETSLNRAWGPIVKF